MRDLEAVVDFAFAIHPLAALRLSHQLGEAMLDHARADTGKNVVAALLLQYDDIDAFQMQELGQQKARRATADDANLNLHSIILPSRLLHIASASFLQIARRKWIEGSAFVLYNSNMRTAVSTPTIRVYNLFGESGDLPDVVHCETIASRSVMHDWMLAVHRHARLHQVLLIERGGGEATLDGHAVPLRPMQIVNVPVGHVHGFRFVPGTQGWVLTIAAEILDEALLASEGLRSVLSRSAVVRGTPQIRAAMKQIFAEHAARNFGRAHVLRSLSATVIGLVARALTGESRDGWIAASDLFRRFEALIETHYLKRWSVADYAKTLSVTPTHLNRVTRAATGDTASHLILNRLIREARRNLVYTNLPVSTIAYALGFDDPAYFSRVYAAATGLSPSAFRAQIHGEEA
jgi:AraC family transcriptional activator of pobA